jgi:hypothetical protein
VLINKSVPAGPSFKSKEKEGSLAESNAEAQMLAQTEAGRHSVSNEELQPSNKNPPPEMEGALDAPQKKPVQKLQEEQLDLAKEQRESQTGYALRHKPKKARLKDL